MIRASPTKMARRAGCKPGRARLTVVSLDGGKDFGPQLLRATAETGTRSEPRPPSVGHDGERIRILSRISLRKMGWEDGYAVHPPAARTQASHRNRGVQPTRSSDLRTTPRSRPSPGMGPRLHGELRHGELRKERMEGNGKGEAQTMNSQALSMKDLDARAA